MPSAKRSGRAISGHPIDRFVNDLPRFITGRIVDYIDADKPAASAEGGRAFFGGKPVAIAGVVEELRKRGPRIEVVLDDDSGRISVGFFDETFQQYREILVKDALLLIEGKLRFDEFANTWVLRANKVSELERLREKEARRIVLKVRTADSLSLDKLQGLLSKHRGGGCQVAVQFFAPGARGTFSFGAGLECQADPGSDRRSREVVGPWPHRSALQPAAGERRSNLHQRIEFGAGPGNRDNFCASPWPRLFSREVIPVCRHGSEPVFSRPYGSEFPRFRAADRRT